MARLRRDCTKRARGVSRNGLVAAVVVVSALIAAPLATSAAERPSPKRVGVLGYGEYRPVADNASASGSSKNRRVEVYLVPVGSIVASGGSTGIDREAHAGG